MNCQIAEHVSARCLTSDRSCGGTPHPASPRFASLTKAPHPSPTRGEETLIQSPEPPRVPRLVALVAKALAVFGGAVALAVAAVVVASVLRRWLFSQPIPGDFELAQIGTAVAVFAFLPYCQVTRGNIVVEI